MILYKNGNFLTMDAHMPTGNYMVVEDGIIADVGMGDIPEKYCAAVQMDLKGRTVIPGFWETHLHIIDGMRSLTELNMRSMSCLQTLKEKLEAYCKRLSADDWVIGHGWDESLLFGGCFPTRQLMDALCQERPFAAIRMDGHSLCLNTCAMKGLDLLKPFDSAEVPAGADGFPAGMFFENAASEIAAKIRRSLSEAYLERLVLEAQSLFVENGICSVNDICTAEPRILDLYRRLEREGKLRIRVTAAADGLNNESVLYFNKHRGSESEHLRIGFPKLFMDGSFGSRTALLYDEYSDDHGNIGLRLLEESKLDDVLKRHNSNEIPVTVHAIGDLAVSSVLDSMERIKDQIGHLVRNRIEHMQIIRESDIGRFKALAATASFQPVFLYEEEMTLARLGESRLNQTYRFRSMVESGANVVFNSDWPYGGGSFPAKKDGTPYIGFEPILGIHAAASHHHNMKERLTVMEALKCYTINSAYANNSEVFLGRLKQGYKADFIVLSEDMSVLTGEQVKDVDVVMTVVNGELLYMRENT